MVTPTHTAAHPALDHPHPKPPPPAGMPKNSKEF